MSNREYEEVLKYLLHTYDSAILPSWLWEENNIGRGMFVIDLDNDLLQEIIVSGDKSDLHVLDHNGRLKWTFHTGGSVWNVFAADIDSDQHIEIIAGCWDKNLYILNSDGTIKWQYLMEDEIWAVYAEDIDGDGEIEVLAGSWSGKIYVLSSLGQLKNIFEVGDEVKAIVVIEVDNTGRKEIIIGCHNGAVLALDQRGSTLWKFVTPGPIRGINVLDLHGNKVLAIASRSGSIYSLDKNGNKLWIFETGRTCEFLCSGDINGDGFPEIIPCSKDGFVYFISHEGLPLWRSEFQSGLVGVSLSKVDGGKDSKLIVSSQNKWVKAFPLKYLLQVVPFIKTICRDIGDDLYSLRLTPEEDRNLRYVLFEGGFTKELALIPQRKVTSAQNLLNRHQYVEALSQFLQLRFFPFELVDTFKVENRIRTIYALDADSDSVSFVFGGQDSFLRYCQRHKIQWQRHFPGWVFNTRVMDINNDGSYEIVIGTRDGNVYALSLLGDMLWEHNIGDFVWSVICLDINGDGKFEILTGGRSKEITILDCYGELLSSFIVPDKIWFLSNCKSKDNTYIIIVGCWNGGIYGYNPITQEMVWRFEDLYDEAYGVFVLNAQSPIDDPLVPNIIVGSKDGYVYALDNTGVLCWKHFIGREVHCVTALHAFNVVSLQILIGTEAGDIHILDLDGNLIRTYYMGSSVQCITAIETIGDRYAITGQSDGKLQVLKLVDLQQVELGIKQCAGILLRLNVEKVLKDLAMNKNHYIRGFAAEYISSNSRLQNELLDVFERLSSDPSPYVRSICASMMVQMASLDFAEFRDLIDNFVTDVDASVRSSFVRIIPQLAVYRPIECFEAAKRLLKDGDLHVCRDAIRSLGYLSRRFPLEVFKLLIQRIHETREWLQHEIARSLAEYLDVYPESLLANIMQLLVNGCPPFLMAVISRSSHNNPVHAILYSFQKLQLAIDKNELVMAYQDLIHELQPRWGFIEYSEELTWIYVYLLYLLNIQSLDDIAQKGSYDAFLPSSDDLLYTDTVQTVQDVQDLLASIQLALQNADTTLRASSLQNCIKIIDRKKRMLEQRYLLNSPNSYSLPEGRAFEVVFSQLNTLLIREIGNQ